MFSHHIASMLVSLVAATCLVCPEARSDDTQPIVCASNTYGSTNVTESEYANWNCQHPLNKYTVISNTPCAPVTNTCGVNNCGLAGPTVCGKLPGLLLAYSTAIFANVCQLNYYNCVNPAKGKIFDSLYFLQSTRQ